MSGEQTLYLGVKGGVHKNLQMLMQYKDYLGQETIQLSQKSQEKPIQFLVLALLYKIKSIYFSVSVPNFLNPKNYTDDISFIGSQKPATYLLAGAKFPLGAFNSTLNPYISQKIIPGIGNTLHLGGTIDYKGVIEFGGGYKSTLF